MENEEKKKENCRKEGVKCELEGERYENEHRTFFIFILYFCIFCIFFLIFLFFLNFICLFIYLFIYSFFVFFFLIFYVVCIFETTEICLGSSKMEISTGKKSISRREKWLCSPWKIFLLRLCLCTNHHIHEQAKTACLVPSVLNSLSGFNMGFLW